MPKQTDRPLVPVALRLYEGDKEVLARFYPEIGYNAAVRELVTKHVAKLKELESRQGLTHVPAIDIDPADPLFRAAGG